MASPAPFRLGLADRFRSAGPFRPADRFGPADRFQPASRFWPDDRFRHADPRKSTSLRREAPPTHPPRRRRLGSLSVPPATGPRKPETARNPRSESRLGISEFQVSGRLRLARAASVYVICNTYLIQVFREYPRHLRVSGFRPPPADLA